jgi:hypothetical protein
MADRTKVPLSARALIQRLNRAMAEDELCVKKARANAALTLGDFYVLSTTRNVVMERDADLEALGKKWKVLQPYEELSE